MGDDAPTPARRTRKRHPLLLTIVAVFVLIIAIGGIQNWIDPPQTTAQRLASAPGKACAAIVADLNAGSPASGDDE